MLINEVVVKEAYREDLLIAVQDLLTYAMKRDIAKISTEKFKSAAESLDIRVLDHIIVTEKNYFSFADESVL